MNKAQLTTAVAAQLGLPPTGRAAAEVVDAVLDTIVRTVVAGERVSITGFGAFEAVDRSARNARNPQTGERVKVRAARIPRFRPGQGFKDYVGGTAKLPKRGPAVRKAAKGSLTGGRTNMPAPKGSPRARAEARAARATAKAGAR